MGTIALPWPPPCHPTRARFVWSASAPLDALRHARRDVGVSLFSLCQQALRCALRIEQRLGAQDSDNGALLPRTTDPRKKVGAFVVRSNDQALPHLQRGLACPPRVGSVEALCSTAGAPTSVARRSNSQRVVRCLLPRIDHHHQRHLL